LFLGSHKGDIETVAFTRPDKWDSLNVEIYYNLFMSSATYMKLSASSAIASRFLNYNQYGADGRFVFCPDTKTVIPKGLADWQKSWANGANADEASVIQSGGSGSFEQGVLALDVSFVSMPFVSRVDIIGDYSGTVWTEENCVAGPFCGGVSSIHL
jgi:hypothetical protein